MLREVRAALATAQAAQTTAQLATGAGTTVIPKPRGTSGRGDFNLAKEMKVDTKLCHEIQVSTNPVFRALLIYPVSLGFCPFTCEHVSPRQERLVEKSTRGRGP